MNVIELAHCANGAQLGEAEHNSEKIQRTTVQRGTDSIGKELYMGNLLHRTPAQNQKGNVGNV
jgi:hypothetical protein